VHPVRLRGIGLTTYPDLPKAVEEYAHRYVLQLSFHCLGFERIVPHSVAPAIASNYSRAGVVVNFVTATGGDVEMLRSIECFYKYVALSLPKFRSPTQTSMQNQMRKSL
jgi:hypothetical protein